MVAKICRVFHNRILLTIPKILNFLLRYFTSEFYKILEHNLNRKLFLCCCILTLNISSAKGYTRISLSNLTNSFNI